MTLTRNSVQDTTIKTFHRLVDRYFFFLVEDYSYQQEEDIYDQKEHYKDKTYIIRYQSSNMLVEVSWYFAASIIDVVFVEPVNGQFDGKRSVFPTDDDNVHRMVDIYTLAHHLHTTEDLLLQDTHISTLEAVKERYIIIHENLEDVITGLANATKRHASSILQGDTTLFDTLMTTYQTLIASQYPIGMF